MAKRIVGIGRLRDGPKRSRVKLGCRPVVFFILTALLVGACAIAINIDLEDRVNAYNAGLWDLPHGP